MLPTDNLNFIEKSLLSGKWDPRIQQDSVSPALHLAKMVVGGSFREALTSSYAQKLFTFHSISNDFIHAFDPLILLAEDEEESELLRLVIAIACLHAFVQANWTGPDLDVKPLDILVLPSDGSTTVTEQAINQKAIAELAYGGEPVYHLAQCAIFLRLAQVLLDSPYRRCQSSVWWSLRVHLVHQQVLDEPVVLPEEILNRFERWESPFSSDDELAGGLLLEIGLLHHTFSQDKLAAEYFVRAARATQLQYELTGALGKRTKFQQNELSQLVLLAESHLPDDASKESSSSSETTAAQAPVPEGLALNDDTLLEQTEFTSSNPSSSSTLQHLDPTNQPPLHPLDQSILLSLCLNVRNTSPLHGLTSEQMSPYVARVISHPRNWSIHTMALLLRSRLESTRTRTVERSTLQLQALVDQMPATDADAASVSERLLYFHSIPLPTKWDLERELATRFVSLGVTRSALEIYERLEMWEEVVKCHVSLERPDRGLTIVKELLEGTKVESDTVISRGKTFVGSDADPLKRIRVFDSAREAKLWCILGDLEPERAVDHYKHAWEVSGHTSGRSMRSLGGYHFARGEYTQAKECLREAVKINPLLSRSWFILGCSCMRLEDWVGARDAFGRCVAIDEDDGESWSNLASMYLRLGTSPTLEDENEEETSISGSKDNERLATSISVSHTNKLLAFRALKEGLKRSYENWKMWSNYMIIAVDVGELAEACRALGRVVEETSNKSGEDGVVLDEDVLDRLVNAVTRAPSNPEQAIEATSAEGTTTGEMQPVINPNEGHGLYPRVLDLFDRTILPRISSVRVFRAYARLMTWQGKWEEALKAWMDAYREGLAGKLARGEVNALATTAQDGNVEEDAGRQLWRDAVGQVEEIVDVLRNLGPRLVSGNPAGSKKWRLQAKSVVRSFMGRTRENFEDDPEWGRLETLLEELKHDLD